MSQIDNNSQQQNQEVDSLESVSRTFSTYCFTIPLGKWCDIKLDLSVFYVILWTFLGFPYDMYTSFLSATYWLIIVIPIFLISLIIHEFGHAMMAKKLGGKAPYILIWPLGGIAVLDHDKGPWSDFLITIAGPLTHIPQAIFWVLCLLVSLSWNPYCFSKLRCLFNWKTLFFHVCKVGAQFNLALCTVNLLIPIYPLDGGRALLDLFLCCRMSHKSAAISVVIIAVPLTLAAGIAALIFLGDWTTFIVCLILLVPNGVMVYLVYKDNLDLHPSFRNLTSSNINDMENGSYRTLNDE